MFLIYYFGHLMKYMGCALLSAIIFGFMCPPLGWIVTFLLFVGGFAAAYQDAVKSVNKKQDRMIAKNFERALNEYNKQK